MEGAALDEGSRTAVALAVADTLIQLPVRCLPGIGSGTCRDCRPAPERTSCTVPALLRSERPLYEQTVNESCQYIVDIASQLPYFTERTLAEVLIRELEMVDIAERIVEEVGRLRAELNPQAEAAGFESDYRRR